MAACGRASGWTSIVLLVEGRCWLRESRLGWLGLVILGHRHAEQGTWRESEVLGVSPVKPGVIPFAVIDLQARHEGGMCGPITSEACLARWHGQTESVGG